ncbi:hypothetical protein VIBNIWn13_870016 [Vibrio nigripulchritudo Wn13]|nr:hypothetical protein VIBNIENn2_310015 [Vibrio nigripulchritudo ENn2]CCO42789.1 hypothetical protein VIBNISFn135_870015 [Vibrio nigripulchritudo SFn135]CCO55577.1 hypothetical protein VIBNIWn13_870016 [Vibrio nigripulchritudo Wn13]
MRILYRELELANRKEKGSKRERVEPLITTFKCVLLNSKS